jgi:hypothetical protein
LARRLTINATDWPVPLGADGVAAAHPAEHRAAVDASRLEPHP